MPHGADWRFIMATIENENARLNALVARARLDEENARLNEARAREVAGLRLKAYIEAGVFPHYDIAPETWGDY